MRKRFTLTRRSSRSGFSLLELIMASVVMSIIAVVITPVIMSSTDAYASSRDARADTDRVLFALERVARLVREAPFAADGSGLDIQSATMTQLLFTDGSGLRLNGSQIELLKPGGQAFVLCTQVDRIQFTYLDNAGDPMPILIPTQIHRVSLKIVSGPVSLETYAMPRAWIGR